MTVRELIHELSQHDGDMEVVAEYGFRYLIPEEVRPEVDEYFPGGRGVIVIVGHD